MLKLFKFDLSVKSKLFNHKKNTILGYKNIDNPVIIHIITVKTNIFLFFCSILKMLSNSQIHKFNIKRLIGNKIKNLIINY
jgi:hypothetical protein